MPVRISRLDLYEYAREKLVPLNDPLAATAFSSADLKPVILDHLIGTHHLGGDDLVTAVDEVLVLIAQGYAIATWYGPSQQIMVLGYRRDQLELAD